MTKLINKIKSLMPEGLKDSKTPENESLSFLIKYDDLNIGKLELDEGKWIFYYTNEFKNQSNLKPLVDFPNIDKIYENDELWPFFLVRIPSLEQPKIQNKIKDEKIDSSNQAELLKVFGKKTISNPFELVTD